MGELKGKMEKFCQYYTSTANGNATLAAKMAGYSAKTAYSIGSENLRKPEISARIRELRFEAVKESGYEPERVRRLLVERLLAIVSARATDVVNVSPGPDDPNRQAALDALAAANGGQRMIDFGETLVTPTAYLPEYVKAAVKKLAPMVVAKCGVVGVEAEMLDPIAAAVALARILEIGSSDANVSVSVDIGEMVDAARKRLERTSGAPAELSGAGGAPDEGDDGSGAGGAPAGEPSSGPELEAWLTE